VKYGNVMDSSCWTESRLASDSVRRSRYQQEVANLNRHA
jgi:hypothetical protein